MADKFVFSKVASSFLVSLLFISLFSVGVYGQEDVVAEGDSSDGSIPSGDFNDIHPVPPVYVCGDGAYYDFVNTECRSPELVGEVEPPGFFEGMFRGIRYFLANDEAKARLTAEIGAEKLTELESALETGDYEAVRSLADEFSDEMARAGEVMTGYMNDLSNSYTYEDYRIESIDDGSVWYSYRNIERGYQQFIADAEISKERILGLVESGQLTQEEADRIIDSMSGPEKLATIMSAEREEFIDKIVDDSNGEVNKWDVYYSMRSEDDAIGFTELHYKDAVDLDDIAINKIQLDEMRHAVLTSDNREFGDVDELFMQARMAQQDARNGLADGDYADAFVNYQKANYLIGTIEQYVESGESALEDIHESVDKSFQDINFLIEEENREIVQIYETEGESIVERYPDYRNEIDKTYTGAANDILLEASIDAVDDSTVEKYKYEGMSEDEAIAKVEALKAREYYYADGGTYYPPGYVNFEDIDGNIEVRYGGGFAKYNPYSNPEGGSYQFGTSGYSFRSPLTKTEYTNNYPANYEPALIERGIESYSYTTESPEGAYTYSYYPTGYTVISPDGTTQEVSYAETSSTVQFVGGAEAKYGLYGYDFISDGGEAYRYVGNPATETYLNLANGHVYSPKVMHHGEAIYNSEERVYEYSLGGVEVDFDPAEKTFEFNDDASSVIAPPVPSAPIGLEELALEQGSIVMEHGETWTYDSEEGVWTSQIVDEETQEEIVTESVVAPNQLYTYDDENQVYYDSTGETVETAVLAGEIWQETPSGNWLSDSGTIYNPVNGETIGSSDSGDSESSRTYGAIYDSEGNEVNRYTFRSDSKFVYNPASRNYDFVSRVGIVDYDPSNPPTAVDASGVTWTAGPNGRWSTSSTTGQNYYYGHENYRRSNDISSVGSRYGEGYYAFADSGRVERNYNYVYNIDGEQKALLLPPGVAPVDSANSEAVRAQIERYGVKDARGYDSAFGTYFASDAGSTVGFGSTPSMPVGTVYSSSDGTFYTKTSDGDWKSSSGFNVGTPPGFGSGGSGTVYAYADYGRGTRSYGAGSSYVGSNFGHVRESDGTWRAVTTASEVASLAGNPDYSPAGAYAGVYASRYQPNMRTENGVEMQTEVSSGRIYKRVEGEWVATERYDTAQTPSSYGGYSTGTGGYGYSGSAYGAYTPGTAGNYPTPVEGFTPAMNAAAQAQGFASAAAQAAYYNSGVGSYSGAVPGSGAMWSSSGGYVGPGYTGGYDSAAAAAGSGGASGGYTYSSATGTWSDSSGNAVSGGYGSSAYGSPTQYGGYPSGGSPEGSSYGGSTVGSGGWSSGSGTGEGSTGGSTGGSGEGGTSGGTASGGGESSGGSTGGSGGGGEGGGGTGGVIAEESARLDNWFVRFFRRLFGN